VVTCPLNAIGPAVVTKGDIRLNDFARQWADTGDDVLAATRIVGESGLYILGNEVANFEQELASVLGVCYTVCCASGLDAIEICLRAVGIRPNDRVLTTPLTAFATTLAVVRAGGVPVFVDVDASGLMDLDATQSELELDPNIRYLLPVHLYGHAVDLDRIEKIVHTLGVTVIEDLAQAVGARWKGRPVGTAGKVNATSFYPTKNLGAMGDGGAVITMDAGLAARCRHLRDYGQTSKYVHDFIGLNSRLDEVHAAILRRAFLPRLGRWTQRRRELALRYKESIRHPRVTLLPVPEGSESVWHLFPITVHGQAERSALLTHLRNCKVQAAIHYPKLVTEQAALNGVEFRVAGPLRNAAALAAGEVSLPIHPYLTDDEADAVIHAVNTWTPA